MPYADPARQREAKARWYRERYWQDAQFAQQESERKAAWLQTEEGKWSNAAASSLAREKARQAKRRRSRATFSRP